MLKTIRDLKGYLLNSIIGKLAPMINSEKIQRIRRPPHHVQTLEREVSDAISDFLCQTLAELNTRDAHFLVEPWVHFFIHSALHRLEQSTIPLVLTTSIFKPVSNDVPGDTLAFYEYLRTSNYCDYIDASLAGMESDVKCRRSTEILREPTGFQGKTLCYKSCFPRNFRYLIRLRSLGQVQFLSEPPEYHIIPVNVELRTRFEHFLITRINADRPMVGHWIARHIVKLFPVSLLENIQSNYAEKIRWKKKDILYSADAWHIIDDWRLIAIAQKNRHPTKWVGSPNAISHGTLAVFWQREFELKFLDKYLTWGWIPDHTTYSENLTFHPPHQAGKRQSTPSRSSKLGEILISTAARPKHLLEYPYTPERFAKYLDLQLSLAARIYNEAACHVAIRTRPKDLGWGLPKMVEYLSLAGVTHEFQTGKFNERLKRSKLHICDNCSTTIIESMWENHPTLIFFTDDYFQLNPSRKQDYEILRKANIFFDDMDLILKHIQNIVLDIDRWWGSPDVQLAVKRFLVTQGAINGTSQTWLNVLRKK